MLGFSGYAVFSKWDILFLTFFLVSEKQFERADLPARFFQQAMWKQTYLSKRVWKFEGPSWAAEGNLVPLIKREVKLLVWSPGKLTAGNHEIAAISTDITDRSMWF